MVDLAALFPEEGCEPGASAEAIAAAEAALGVTFPEDYRAFIRHTDGFNGYVRGDEAQYLRMHDVEEVVAATERTDVVVEDFPGHVVVGDTGASWIFALDMGPDGPRYREIGMGEGEVLTEMGTTFAAFLEAFTEL